MPQLIAMIIVVVGAMIYMFQTFGGTGDKIEGIAQKTSVITEINNIKNGLKLAAKSEAIGIGTGTDSTTTNVLGGLAELAYFPEQVNSQIISEGDTTETPENNNYYAISFGGEDDTEADSAMRISLVADKAGMIPGIYVEFSLTGSLGANAGFLESQIANDLKEIANIDRTADIAFDAAATAYVSGALPTVGTPLERRIPGDVDTTTLENDGKFIIYFRDFAADEVVVAE
ncbi:hypothetical protein [Poseidonibacter antarcticus]|uniref:hypothetical protein n=1 Tax=Poseidonibacter antarcticus TaxID=2478538 RepID=UPI000EF49BC7|nr:hypothetical protein [Poseidonibacter antarcticus]